MRFARGDMRDIVSHKNDHGASYERYGVLQWRSRLKISSCEIFGVVRFSTFATWGNSGIEPESSEHRTKGRDPAQRSVRSSMSLARTGVAGSPATLRTVGRAPRRRYRRTRRRPLPSTCRGDLSRGDGVPDGTQEWQSTRLHSQPPDRHRPRIAGEGMGTSRRSCRHP